jgi:hypothetical protein
LREQHALHGIESQNRLFGTPVTKEDQYRAYADLCGRMAGRASRADDKACWLKLAADWLTLIRTPAQSATERFDCLERDRGTGQEISTAEH